MKKLAATLFAVFALVFAGATNATPIKWNLSGVTFSDSTSVSGSFFYDAVTNTYSSWSISVESGSLPSFLYNPADSSVFGLSSAKELVLFSAARYLDLDFIAPLSDAGGSVALKLTTALGRLSQDAGSWECRNDVCDATTARFVSGGSVVSANVPEPTSIALLGVALVGLCVVRRKRH